MRVEEGGSLEIYVLCDEPGELGYNIYLEGERASAEVKGLWIGRDDIKMSMRVQIHHDADKCSSLQVLKGIATDKSQIGINSGVVVAEHTVGNDAEQQLHNLLLSERAVIDTSPELQIYADDVKCSHGATVGQLDKDALYYLQSRGIDYQQARSMLLIAFGIEPLKECHLGISVAQKLEDI